MPSFQKLPSYSFPFVSAYTSVAANSWFYFARLVLPISEFYINKLHIILLFVLGFFDLVFLKFVLGVCIRSSFLSYLHCTHVTNCVHPFLLVWWLTVFCFCFLVLKFSFVCTCGSQKKTLGICSALAPCGCRGDSHSVVRLVGKCLHPLNCLISPWLFLNLF